MGRWYSFSAYPGIISKLFQKNIELEGTDQDIVVSKDGSRYEAAGKSLVTPIVMNDTYWYPES